VCRLQRIIQDNPIGTKTGHCSLGRCEVNFATCACAEGLTFGSGTNTARVEKQTLLVGGMVHQVMYFASKFPCELFPVSEKHDFCTWILPQDEADIEDGAEICL
jgi:hypothetical protein